MAFNIIYDQPDVVGPWVCARTGGVYCKEISQAIGQLNSKGEIVAGVLFEGFNGATVKGHIAIEPGYSFSRTFLWAIGDYAFRQIKVRKVIGLVNSTNTKAIELDKKLGYVEEGRIKGGTVDGDLLILTLTAENYRYIGLTQDDIIKRL